MTLLGINIPKIVNGAIGNLLLDGTLTRIVRSGRTTVTSGLDKTETAYTFKGFFDDYREGDFDGTLVQDGDRKAFILADSLTSGITPQVGDKVTIESEEKKIIKIKRDPAGATYTCQVR